MHRPLIAASLVWALAVAPVGGQVQTVDPVGVPRQVDAETQPPLVRKRPLPEAVGLTNGLVRFDFSVDGTALALTSITNVVDGKAPIACEPGAGAWTFRLMREDTAATEWVDISMDGSFTRSAALAAACPLDGSEPDCRLDALDLIYVLPFGGGDTEVLTALWRGRFTLGGVSTGFEVETYWNTVVGQSLADARIRVALDPVDERLDYYLSQVLFPSVRLTAFDSPDDTLILPYRSGSRIENPTEFCFPAWLGTGSDAQLFYSVEAMAYHDGDDLAPNAFYFSTTDVEHYFKRMLAFTSTSLFPAFWDPVACAVQGPPGWIEFNLRHVPANVFVDLSYETPYAVRLGAIEGDWWDVADTYKAFLEQSAPWYAGPIGSPAHPAPDAAKRMTSSSFLQPGFEGDDMDGLGRAMMDVARVLGRDVHTTWYQWHTSPFARLLAKPYLPGAPSFASAVDAAQEQWGMTVAPYISATKGAGLADPSGTPDPCPIEGEQVNVDASRLILENGEDVHIVSINDPGIGVFLCPGGTWWKDFLPAEIVATTALSGAKGTYLDFVEVAQVPCYALDHAHDPGGGNWMFAAREQQLADVATGLAALPDPPDDFIVSIETAQGWGTPYTHLMYEDPAGNRVSILKPGAPGATPLPNAVTIPFFRTVYDNVRISKLTGSRFQPPERRAWVEAALMTTFGQAPGFTHQFTDAFGPFTDRAEAGPYNEFSGLPLPPGAGDGAGAASPGDGTPVTYVEQPRVTARYLWLMGRMTAALRGDVYGSAVAGAGLTSPRRDLLTWHNGTLRRLPAMTITPPVGFDGIPGTPVGSAPPTPLYVEDYLTPGMYQAPADSAAPDAGSLCLMVVNPWVAPEDVGADVTLDFGIADFGVYPGWSNAIGYTVTAYDVDGNEVSAAQPAGPFQLSTAMGLATLPPGAVAWWVFRQD